MDFETRQRIKQELDRQKRLRLKHIITTDGTRIPKPRYEPARQRCKGYVEGYRHGLGFVSKRPCGAWALVDGEYCKHHLNQKKDDEKTI